MHASSELIIDIDDISYKINNQLILQNISLCVHQSEFIGIIGPNGAGKTSLLSIITGLVKPTTGKFYVQPSNIGYIPQQTGQADAQVPINVLEVVKMGAKGNSRLANNALNQVNMQKYAHTKFSNLSGGQRQLVLIAKAIASSPQILILDEPTTGVDEHSQLNFFKILNNLQNNKVAIVMVSHDIDSVLSSVSRIICLNKTILYDGPVNDFESNKIMPLMYGQNHKLIHHKHGKNNA